jgi:hypothetical protein
MASASLSYKRRNHTCSQTSLIACEPTSPNDLPQEILLKIFSYCGPEDLRFIIAKVCEKWNVLAKDVVLWKKLSYKCEKSSDISRIAEVRCTALLVCRNNWLMNVAPSTVLKVQDLKGHFRSWTSSHPEVRQVSRDLHCVTQSDCEQRF